MFRTKAQDRTVPLPGTLFIASLVAILLPPIFGAGLIGLGLVPDRPNSIALPLALSPVLSAPLLCVLAPFAGWALRKGKAGWFLTMGIGALAGTFAFWCVLALMGDRMTATMLALSSLLGAGHALIFWLVLRMRLQIVL